MNKRFVVVLAVACLAGGAARAQDSFGGGGQGGGYQQQPYPPQGGGWGQQPQAGGQPQQGGGWGQQPQQPQGGGQGGGWGQQPQVGGYPQQLPQWGQQPPGQQPQQPPQWGQQPQQPQMGGMDLDRLMQMERQDFGVPPTDKLHAGAPHGPTPASIPGGQVITTKGLIALIQGGQMPYFIFDVLGAPEELPNAMPAPWLAQPGSFDDDLQKQFAQMLQQGTQGRNDMPLIFYCASPNCWMSYNAALRAIKAGYRNVLWYRGGLEAWKAAGLPTQPSRAYQQQTGGGGQQPQQ